MKQPNTVPNGRLLIESIGLTQDRLFFFDAKLKVAIPGQLLKELLLLAASTLPFEQGFYLATYPDIREAYEAGRITDPRAHFIEKGYLEGRVGSIPNINEEYYKSTYPDVEVAIAAGALESALDHYVRFGALEGRSPNLESVANTKRWLAILGRQ